MSLASKCLLGAALFAAASLAPSAAHAQDADAEEAESPKSEANEKAGPFMATLRFGPALKVTQFISQFAMGPEIGYAIVDDGYLVFSPSFQFGDATVINLPLGFQYDIALPVDNLYAYARFTAGVAIATASGASDTGFNMQPEAGAKYLFTENFYAGIEPLSFPMYIESDFGMQYRLSAFGGAHF